MSSNVEFATDYVSDSRLRRPVIWAGCLAYSLLLIRTAWVCDDAYVTFRTVSNFLNGDGLRWNIHNRVQAFTHPLWMFVMSGAAAITRDVYYTSIFLSIALSAATVALVLSRLASSLPMALIALSALTVSKSFVEYSTSGLEDALTHLLLVGFFIVYASMARPARRRLFALTLLSALLMLNRLDAGLLVMPALVASLWRARVERRWMIVATAMLPLVAWELFSVVYYGFLVPNTAYAKLSHGVPRLELVHQGLLYLLDAVNNDPVTPLLILAAVLSPFVGLGGWACPGGIVLYVIYIVFVGGDFMSGRFLAAPVLCAVIQVSQLPVMRFSIGWALAVSLIWLSGLSAPRSPLFSGATYGADVKPNDSIPPSHVNDERRYYYPYTGLLTAHRGVPMPNHYWYHLGEDHRRDKTAVLRINAAGFIGYAAGPGTRFIDEWGLGDPLMARLPAEASWEIGHFTKRIPAGYERTVETGHNFIEDTGVAAYFEKLRIITEDPLWSRRRFLTMLRMNLGNYEPYIAFYGMVRRSYEDVATVRPDGSAWNAPGVIVMTPRGVEILLSGVRPAGHVEVSVSGNDTYRVVFLEDGRQVDQRVIAQPLTIDGSLRTHALDAPVAEFNTVRILPSGGDSRYSFGHLRVLP